MMTARRTRARLHREDEDEEHHAPDFTAALRVLLQRQSDFVSGHEMQATLAALLGTSHATGQTLTHWASKQLARDITRGHEDTAIRVHSIDNQPHVHELLLLLRFKYTTRVRIPVAPELHELPRTERERLCRENDDVARVVHGCRLQLYARYSQETGWGIHAAQRIARGEYVGEYTGELLASAEARRRHTSEYDRTRLNYVLALREQTREGGAVRTNVDATRLGGYARFFNHSCAPTLRVEAVRVDSFVPRLVFFTRRELVVDEQLTFDYGCGASAVAATAEATPRTSTVICHCWASSCRGVMPFDASL